MFTLIEPKYHCFYKSRIERFVSLMQKYQQTRLSVSEQNSATFIVGEDETAQTYGGAQLLQKKVNQLPEKIRKHIDCFLSQDALVWTCTVFMHIENESSLTTTAQYEIFCGTFYRNLYEKLVEFGESQGMGFLCMILNPGEHLCTEEMGLWSYVVGIDPSESSDHLFHGILSLMGCQHEAYKEKWQRLDKEQLECNS